MEDKMYDVSQVVIDFKNAILGRSNIDYAHMLVKALEQTDLNLQPIVLPQGPDDINFPRAILNSADSKVSITLTGKQLVVRFSENVPVLTHINAVQNSGAQLIVDYGTRMLNKLVEEDVIPNHPIAKYQYQAIGYYTPSLDTSRKTSATIEEISRGFMSEPRPKELASFGQYYEVKVPNSPLIKMYQVITAKNNNTEAPVLQLTLSYSEKNDKGIAVSVFEKRTRGLNLLAEMSDELNGLAKR